MRVAPWGFSDEGYNAGWCLVPRVLWVQPGCVLSGKPMRLNVDLECGECAAAEPVMKSLLGFFFLFKTMTSVKPKIWREHLGEGGGWPVKLTLLNIRGTECGGARLTFFLGYLRKSKRDAHSASWLSPPGTSLNGTDLVATGCKTSILSTTRELPKEAHIVTFLTSSAPVKRSSWESMSEWKENWGNRTT